MMKQQMKNGWEPTNHDDVERWKNEWGEVKSWWDEERDDGWKMNEMPRMRWCKMMKKRMRQSATNWKCDNWWNGWGDEDDEWTPDPRTLVL